MGKLTNKKGIIFTLGTYKIGERVVVQDEEGKDHLVKIIKSLRGSLKYISNVLIGREGKTKKVDMGKGYYEVQQYEDEPGERKRGKKK